MYTRYIVCFCMKYKISDFSKSDRITFGVTQMTFLMVYVIINCIDV